MGRHHPLPHLGVVLVEHVLGNSAPPHLSYADGPGLATILLGDKNEARAKHPSPTCLQGASCSENLGSMQSSNQPVDGAAPIATQHVSQMLRPHARRPGPTEPSEVYAVKRPWKFLSVGHSRNVVGRGGADGIWRSRLGVGKQFRRPPLLLGRGQLGRRGEQRLHGLAVRTALGHSTSTLSTRSSCPRPSCSRALLALNTVKKFEETPVRHRSSRVRISNVVLQPLASERGGALCALVPTRPHFRRQRCCPR